MRHTIATVIGENARAIREEHGRTLDDVARASRGYGAAWNTGRVSRIERGDGAVTVEALFLLALILTDLTGYAVTPVRLLKTVENVELGSGEVIPGGVLWAVFSGHMRAPLEPSNAEGASSADREHFTLADERASRKLGMTQDSFMAHSMKLWGHSMSKEVEKRSGPDDSPQKKGRITRVLLDELREAINRGND